MVWNTRLAIAWNVFPTVSVVNSTMCAYFISDIGDSSKMTVALDIENHSKWHAAPRSGQSYSKCPMQRGTLFLLTFSQ